MPELPEVETIRRSLEPLLVGKQIETVQIDLPKALGSVTPEAFHKAVAGAFIEAVERRGKYLILRLSNEQRIVFHLRMTGRLIFCAKEQLKAKYTTLILEFADGWQLRFEDTRKFGTVDLIELSAAHTMNRLGPEPLSSAWKVEDLIEVAKGRHMAIKGVLLDQSVIAGLGNIYADEALFRAKIRPDTPTDRLKPKDWKHLYQAIREVLAESIDHRGTTKRDYVDGRGEIGDFQNHLQVYGKTGQPCPICGSTIRRLRIAGRSSHFCIKCQRKPGGDGP